MTAALALRAAGAFFAKHWRVIAAVVPILVLALTLHIRTGQRDDARQERDLIAAQAVAFAADVRATAERVRSTYAQNALRVEREQTQVTEEVSDEFQARIADLHRRVAALRLRTSPGGADPGGAAGDRHPGFPDAAGGTDAAAAQAGLPAPGLSLQDAIVATEQAIQLDELIRWLTRQMAIVRTPAKSAEPPAAAAAR